MSTQTLKGQRTTKFMISSVLHRAEEANVALGMGGFALPNHLMVGFRKTLRSQCYLQCVV